YGHGESMTAAERHFSQSSNLALPLLTGNTEPQVRMNVVLHHLTTALAASGLSIPETARLIDPQAILARARPTERRQIASNAHATYRARGASLCEQTFRLWALNGGAPAANVPEAAGPHRTLRAQGTGPAAAWSHSVRVLAARLTVLAGEGTYTPITPAHLCPDSAWAGTRKPADKKITVHHVLSHVTHEFANRVGISFQQETYLRLLLAHALHDLAPPRAKNRAAKRPHTTLR
ncbi:lantibiotic dehydratase C-terminal domain-containing protein, partial [Streptomyces erythrochromogenes]